MATDALPTLSDVLGDVPASSTNPSYLSHLTSLSLPQILQEPASLASEASFLTSELTNLCHSQYQTFLSLHTASTALSSSFSSFSSSLSALVDAVPALESQCATFAAETRVLREDRRKVTTVLEQHEKLLDILEIPQLIDTCVKNGYYQEALDLANHTEALVKRFPTVPIVRSVQVEVTNAINQMHSQLLQLLQEPAKLPSLLKAVNFLRRMAVLDEEELALAFLTSRGAYMRALFEAIERERTMDAARFLKKWIELWREGVYDIVTQFTSIFLERPPPQSSFPPDLRPFLTSFTNTLVHQLLSVISRTIPQITDSPALSSLLTQLSYCSSSFARAGLDFRTLLPPIFERAAEENFRRGVEGACAALRGSVDKALGTRRGTSVRLPSTWMVAQGDAAVDPPVISLASTTTGSVVFVPSSQLTAYPPFAILLNATLSSLNSLRLLAPVALLPSLLSILIGALDRTAATLLTYLQTSLNRARRSFDMNDSAEADRREKRVVLGVVRAWVYVVRFVRRGLVEGVYGRRGSVGGEVDWAPWEEWLRALGEEGMLPLGEVESDVKEGASEQGEVATDQSAVAGEETGESAGKGDEKGESAEAVEEKAEE